jgi:hypothetical protein
MAELMNFKNLWDGFSGKAVMLRLILGSGYT